MTIEPASNEVQRDYFGGRRLPRMDPVARSATPYTLRHVDEVIGAAGLTPRDDVLDVGCGPGKYTVALLRRGLRVEGMDLTPALVDQLRAVAPEVSAHVGDLGAPPAGLVGRFDAVVGFFVLHHIEHLEQAMMGVRSLLRPGGRAVFLEPNPLFPGYYVQVTFTPGMSWRGEKGILRMRRRVLQAAADGADLELVDVDGFGAFPPFLANHAFGRRVEAGLEAVPGWRRFRAFQRFSLVARSG